MTWFAVGAAVVGAAGSAYSARQQRRASEQGATQDSGPWGPTSDHLYQILRDAGQLYNWDQPQFSPYRPYGGEPGQYGPVPTTASAPGGNANRPQGSVAAQPGMRYNKAGQLVPIRNPEPGQVAAPSAPAGPPVTSIQDLFNFGQGQIPQFFNPQSVAGSNPFLGNLMQPGGTNVSNPALDALLQRGLGSGGMVDNPALNQFIEGMFGATGFGSPQAPAGPARPGGGTGTSGGTGGTIIMSGPMTIDPKTGQRVSRAQQLIAAQQAQQAAAQPPTMSAPMNVSASQAPEAPGRYGYSTANLNGLLSPWLQDTLNAEWLQGGNPHLQGMMDSFTNEAMEDYKKSAVPQIDSTFQRAGRYGSGAYADAQAKANEEFNEGLMGAKSNLLGNQYQFERGNMLQALGLLNDLQQQQMSGDTARDVANINAQAASASAGAGSAAALEAARLESDYRNKALLLDAIGQFSGNQQFGMGLTGDLAGQFSGDRQFGMGLTGDMAGLMQGGQLGALGLIPGFGGYYNDQQANANQRAGINQAGNLANQARQDAIRQQQWQYDTNQWNFNQNAPRQRLDDYLGIVGPIAGMGGSSRTISPYAGPSPFEAGLMGGLGGYMGMGGGMGGYNPGGMGSMAGPTQPGFYLGNYPGRG